MKLMIIILRDSDSEPVVQELVRQQFRVTRMTSTGGFLRRGNSTLLVGLEDTQVDAVIAVLKKTCRPPDMESQHRATIFVVNMQQFTTI